MKKLCVLACLIVSVAMVNAQHQVISFFDELGGSKIQTEEFTPKHDTIVKVFHRLDDVVWSRYVYRVIDMRYKQNYQLYFPVKSDDPDYRNLFMVITNAVIQGMPIYEKDAETIKPTFKLPFYAKDSSLVRQTFRNPVPRALIPTMFLVDDPLADYSDDPTHYDVSSSDAMLVHYDSITDKLSFHFYPFESVVRNQLKFLIQEVVFFDKHTSRLHAKIMAIAPLNSDKIMTKDGSNVMSALRESIMFWIPFDALRPYMAMQYVIPSQNETRRVTFDEFFQKHLYTSYIVGEGNMYNRFIPEYSGAEDEIKKEQKRIEKELLDFEQDLWEY